MEVEFKFIKGAVEFCILHSAALLMWIKLFQRGSLILRNQTPTIWASNKEEKKSSVIHEQ